MTVTVSLTPEQEARLIADAQAKGLSPEALIQQMIDAAVPPAPAKRHIRSAKGMLAHLGTAPSLEEIQENRREMFRNFAREESEW
jgi:hypothetical protein